MQREPLTRTTITIPASAHADLVREARVRGSSVSGVIRDLVRAHVASLRVLDLPTDNTKETSR
jgi:predicted CopG family antitoxin